MKKLSLILLLSFLILDVWTQQMDINWSPFGDKDKNYVIKKTEKFLKLYIDKDFQKALSYFDKNEINFGGYIWMKPQEFISMIQPLRGNNDLEVENIKAYTMNDTEKDPEVKSKTLKIYRVFSNLSIFVAVDLIDNTKHNKKTIYLNYNHNDENNWIISSFLDPTIGLVSNSSYPKERFRVESFENLKFSIPIPKDFSSKQVIEGQTNFILSGETERDAAIQVEWNEMKAPLNILSYNWVHYIIRQFDHSDILIKYMPYGYKYEYFVKDQNGDLNKGITVAFESNNKFVYIQYFSFSETYNKIWIDIDMMLRNIAFDEL